jgi:hypothetical protein
MHEEFFDDGDSWTRPLIASWIASPIKFERLASLFDVAVALRSNGSAATPVQLREARQRLALARLLFERGDHHITAEQLF